MTDAQDTRTSEGDFQRFLQGAASHRLLTAKEEKRYLRKVKRGVPGAIDELTMLNMRLIIQTAQKYRQWGAARGIPLPDLFNQAAIGFKKGCEKFDLRKNVRLSTYVCWWMRHEIVRHIEDAGRTIRIPIHTQNRIRRIERAKRAFKAMYGRDPERAELARAAKVTDEQLGVAEDAPLEPVSLDAPVPGTPDMHLLDAHVVPDHEAHDPLAELVLKKDKASLADAMRGLTELERKVLDCRFRLELTLVETAARLAALSRSGEALSRERIRQIQETAIAKLRAAMPPNDDPS